MTIEELDFTIHNDTRYRMGREAEEDTDEQILGIARKGPHAMPEERKELFSKRVTAGSRTYFIDVKGSKEGVLYLVITESRPSDEGYEHQSVMVFEENFVAFANALEAAFEFLGLPARGA